MNNTSLLVVTCIAVVVFHAVTVTDILQNLEDMRDPCTPAWLKKRASSDRIGSLLLIFVVDVLFVITLYLGWFY